MMRRQVPDDILDLERRDAHAKVIHVAAFGSRGGAALAAELAVDRYQIDHHVAGTKVHEPKVRAPPVHRAAEDLAIEADHALEVAHTQDDMIDVANLEHARRSLHRWSKLCG